MWAFWLLGCFWVVVVGVANLTIFHSGVVARLMLGADAILFLCLIALIVGDLRHRRHQRLD